MITATVDDRKRVTLPSATPGAVLEVQENADGSITLCPVKTERKEKYPPGSLRESVDDFNREWAGVKPVVPAPPKDDE
jgi:hypothetical protein